MSTEKEKLIKNIGAVVRALTVSTKPPVTLMSILRDYKGLEGEPLPFRKLGYASAEDLLLATDEFIIRRFGDEVNFIAQPVNQICFDIVTFNCCQDSLRITALRKCPRLQRSITRSLSQTRALFISHVRSFRRTPSPSGGQCCQIKKLNLKMHYNTNIKNLKVFLKKIFRNKSVDEFPDHRMPKAI